VARRLRLDAELVRRGLARSREHAADLIRAGRVTVGGVTAGKPATSVGTDAAVVVVAGSREDPAYASRGGHKLAGALDIFARDGLSVEGRSAVDAGASTGGFTDVLLRRGAARVVAVDVGYGQLAWDLRQDSRVTVLDRTNVRDLTVEAVDGPVDLVVADLSFISLTTVLPALTQLVVADGDHALMVKPQFEVGRARLGKGGVVRDLDLRVDAVVTVAQRALSLGLGVRGVCASPLPGPSGNAEYFVWLRRGAPAVDPQQVRAVVLEGPQ
jgi:23S rRNA (cytidine1920-2'-O)/16S rRNA (cytidine1409-2'-O)-methyltransferase